jgi:hypothetical protein
MCSSPIPAPSAAERATRGQDEACGVVELAAHIPTMCTASVRSAGTLAGTAVESCGCCDICGVLALVASRFSTVAQICDNRFYRD